MYSEAAFIAAIAANPDDDLPRLVFADWLEENGQQERADYIRLAIQFDPHRDRFDDEGINATREQLGHFEQRLVIADNDWLEGWSKQVRRGVTIERRRGFVDSVAVPVQWWINYGTAFRERFPTLRKLVLFRLNGWGERLARCESLRGLRELELACWYGDEDAVWVANCSHLAGVDRLTLWGNNHGQALPFARGAFGRNLKELHFVTRDGGPDGWTEVVNHSVGRPIATVYDFGKELFPFAPHFGGGEERYGFFVGRMPDGALLFARGGSGDHTAEGWSFHADGTRREPFRFEFPDELVLSERKVPGQDWKVTWEAEREVMRRRADHFRDQSGYVSEFIRVEGFTIGESHSLSPYRERGDFEEVWGGEDEPNVDPANDPDGYEGGFGGRAYKYVRNGEYGYDFGNEWWCDRTGNVHST